jgi:hypothetical protein
MFNIQTLFRGSDTFYRADVLLLFYRDRIDFSLISIRRIDSLIAKYGECKIITAMT